MMLFRMRYHAERLFSILPSHRTTWPKSIDVGAVRYALDLPSKSVISNVRNIG
jgi:hypothetical protein